MTKMRMASTDVAAEAACIKNKLKGMRLANMYDLSPKTYVLKLSRSGGEGDKVFLLLESGSRFHTTELIRDKADVPSNFTLKLRKHLRTRRLEDVRQLGVDRIVDFVFGSGEATMHLILEMYSQGNIVLTNAHYEVLTLLRSHRDDDKGFAVMARHLYPMQHVRLHQAVTLPELTAALQSPGPEPGTNLKAALAGSVLPYGPTIAEHVILDAGLDPGMKLKPAQPQIESNTAAEDGEVPEDKGDEEGSGIGLPTEEDGEQNGMSSEVTAAEGGGAEPARGGEKGGKKGKGKGKGKQATEATAEQRATWRVISTEELQALHAALKRLDAWFAGLEAHPPIGVITCLPPKENKQQEQQPKGGKKKGRQLQQQQQQDGSDQGTKADEGAKKEEEVPVVYNDFNPMLLTQLKGAHNIELPNFDLALDEFYGKIEGQRAALARADAERNAMSKVERIKMDQSTRVQALAAEAEEAERRASLIQYNLDAVEAAIRAVNEMLATGMDWHDLEALIKDERKAGNPVAQLIHSLQLNTNHITLLLSNFLDTEEEGDEAANTRKATKVSVDLSLSAHANSSIHFDQKKKHIAKQAKTEAAHEASLKVAEKKALTQVQKVRAVPMAQVQRKPHWFEKFNWFITSENYLVISGRDAQQNELLVKRYFVKGDAYVHAELHGAPSTIVKNPDPERPIPPISLQQAGCACVCRSRAWDSKVVTSAWWVHHHQVSKTAPTGEYLTVGSFMVRGRKNFLPPQPLIFGFGFLFKLEDSCIGNHIGERAVRGGMDGDTTSIALGGRDGGAGDTAGDVDIDDLDVNLPGDDDDDGAKQATTSSHTSALEAFMEGGFGTKRANHPTPLFAPRASSAASASASSTTNTAARGSGGGGLTAKAIAAAGAEAPGAGADVSGQYERYNLQLEADEEEKDQERLAGRTEDHDPASGPQGNEAGQASSKRHMSQKEREMLKKAKQKAQKAQEVAAKGDVEASQQLQQQVQQQQQQLQQVKAKGEVQQQQKGKGDGHQPSKKELQQQKQQQGVAAAQAKKQAAAQQAALQQQEAAARGKKAKLARIKEKYADQDEEERQLALSMLASHGEKKSRTDRRKERKSKKEASRQALKTDVVGVDKAAMEDAILKATSSQWQKEQQQQQQQQDALDDGGSSSDSSSSRDAEEGGQRAQAQQHEGPATTSNGDPAVSTSEGLQGTAAHHGASNSGTKEGSTESRESHAAARTAALGAASGAAAAAAATDRFPATDGAHSAGEVQENGQEGQEDRSSRTKGPQENGEGGQDDRDEEEDEGAPVAENEAEQEEVKALLAEENIAVLAEEDKEKLTALDSLTGCPRPEDTLLFALPVCAPYQALQNYKFKVKLVPGTAKKGKAARQAMELLARSHEATQREQDLIRGVPELASINAMVGTVKISMPGMVKLRQDDKKSKKAAAKAKHS